MIEGYKQQVQAATDLDKQEKDSALDLYNQALAQLKTLDDWQAKIAQRDQAIKQAPAQLEQARAELAQPVEDLAPHVPAGATLEQIAQLAGQAADADRAARIAVSTLSREQQAIQDRRQEIPARQAAIRQSQAQISDELQGLSGATTAVDRARRVLLTARRRALWRELRALDRQSVLDQAQQDPLTVQLDLANRHQRQTQQALGLWQDILKQRTAAEAAKVAAQASQQSISFQHRPELYQIAEQCKQLAQQRVELQTLADQIQQTMQPADEIRRQRRTVADNYDSMVKRINTVGLTEAISALLRHQRAQLPDVAHLERNWRRLEAEYASAQMDLIDLDDQRSTLVDLDRRTEQVLASMKTPSAGPDRQRLRVQVQDLLSTKRKYLDDLINEYNSCAKTWLEMEEEDRLLVEQTRKYADFIDEHVLWVRSTHPLQPSQAAAAWHAIRWLTCTTGWKDIATALANSLAAEPLGSAGGLALIALLLAARRRMRFQLQAIDRMAAKGYSYTFAHTLEAMGLTLLLAAPWPGLLWFVGWRLSSALSGGNLVAALAGGLTSAAMLYLVLELTRQICRKNGLGQMHLRWSEGSTRLLRQNLAWLIPAAVPLMLLLATIDSQPSAEYKDSLGRLVFIAGMVLVAFFARAVLRPGAALMGEFLERHPDGWTQRLRYVWYPLAAGTPAAVALAAIGGYYYTATQLAGRILATAGLVLTVLIVKALLLRLLFVGRRRLAIEEARKRQAVSLAPKQAAPATSSAIGGPAGGASPSQAVAKESRIDLASVDIQTRRLIRVVILFGLAGGLWLIWADMLPALGMLDRVTLWSTTADGTQIITGTDGSKIAQTVQKVVPITLGNIALAGLVVLGAVAAARNIPGLLEITLLRLMPMEPGGRYAINAISRYILTAAGLIIAFSTIGIGWSKVQWLIAAMTVGLGFGLQEIFANFVSGLIILFERPVRVGDIVTVGEISGTVSRIRIRATTIVDWDRKELIVPNKEFITSKLINWTLSDQILRIVVPVGVAYGSDTCRVQELLLKIARTNPNVLPNPTPAALFVGFGESSLDFSLRVFVPSPSLLMTVQHDLHMAIDKAFREAGIEIAFPQRDVNIRQVDIKGLLPILGQRPDATPSPGAQE